MWTGSSAAARVRQASIGCPVLGDKLYGQADAKANRQMLHAWKLIFQHPVTKKEMAFEASLPEDFLSLLHQLRYESTRNH